MIGSTKGIPISMPLSFLGRAFRCQSPLLCLADVFLPPFYNDLFLFLLFFLSPATAFPFLQEISPKIRISFLSISVLWSSPGDHGKRSMTRGRREKKRTRRKGLPFFASSQCINYSISSFFFVPHVTPVAPPGASERPFPLPGRLLRHISLRDNNASLLLPLNACSVSL